MKIKPLIVGTTAAVVVAAAGILTAGPALAAPTRFEAETAPAVCTGTIDNNWAGFSGAGFCNGTNAVGAFAQFTVNASHLYHRHKITPYAGEVLSGVVQKTFLRGQKIYDGSFSDVPSGRMLLR